MARISSKRMRDFLEENGVYAVYEVGEVGYYRRSRKLSSLLDTYYIRTVLIPNKL